MRRLLVLGLGAALVATCVAVSTAGAGSHAENATTKKTAWFQLVFEGTSDADRIVDEGGPLGPGCAAQLHDDIHEETTFGRGKGVVMEFVEYGPVKYGFQRLGRIGDSSMNVVGKVTRTAKGGADIVQNTSVPFPCPVLQHHDLSQNPDCGKTKTDNAPWGLKIDGNHFRPVPKGGLGGNFVSQNECGKPPSGSAFQGGGENELEYGWPLPVQFIWQPIPYAKMFNQRYRAFKVDFETLPRPNSKKTSHSGIAGSLETTVSDWGEAHATVRFIRCFPKSVAKAGQPAC